MKETVATMTNHHQPRTSESAPANAIHVVIGEGPNAFSAHTNRSVTDRQPASVADATPKAAHTTQAKRTKPPKIKRKYASPAPVIELQQILLQWIMFKQMKNMFKLTGNIGRKLGGLFCG